MRLLFMELARFEAGHLVLAGSQLRASRGRAPARPYLEYIDACGSTAPLGNVLVVGSGGREHALAWRLSKSRGAGTVYVAPGNGGTRNSVDIQAGDTGALADFARENECLTVVGPEAPLAAGITDEFVAVGLRIVGPTSAATRLESSKSWSKEFMLRHGIPTPSHASFDDVDGAVAHARECAGPLVVKADGLAAGKGVSVCSSAAEAEAEIVRMMGAGVRRVVLEERLEGVEASFIALCDGTTAMPMAASQDHKRAGDADTGPNTGGMGAYSPTPFVDGSVADSIQSGVIERAMAGMREEGMPFCGFMYAGVMIGEGGEISVLEFNARMGDPECQAIMARADFDLHAYLDAAARGRLASMEPMRWSARHAACVVLASRGYPGKYPTGEEISGIGADSEDSVVFHAGTRREGGRTLTSGGRVLGVTALGDTLEGAVGAAYARAEPISWASRFCRSDIGAAGIARA